jgi:uncharacterized protein
LSEPVRTCVACRTRRPQQALLRLRRRSDGVVVPAVGRRTRGRSAYLCPARACFDQALRRRALERALGRVRPEARDGTPPHGEPGQGGPDVALRPRPTRVRSPEPEVLWPAVVAALDHELQNLQRTGDSSQNPRYDALVELRRGLGEPGRSA